MRDDCGWSNNTSKLYTGKATAHLASLPDRSIQTAPLTWHELPSGVLPCSFLETPLPESHMAPCWGPGTIVCLPTKRCDFSNWQSLFKCLATSWQTPMLTVGRGNLRGCEGRRGYDVGEAEFSHYIDSAFPLLSSLESRDISNVIGCFGKRYYSKRRQVPAQEHLLCRAPTKITLGPWRKGWGWWVPEEGRRRKDRWRISYPPDNIYPSMLASNGPAGSRQSHVSRAAEKAFLSIKCVPWFQTLARKKKSCMECKVQQLHFFHSFCHSTNICLAPAPSQVPNKVLGNQR